MSAGDSNGHFVSDYSEQEALVGRDQEDVEEHELNARRPSLETSPTRRQSWTHRPLISNGDGRIYEPVIGDDDD